MQTRLLLALAAYAILGGLAALTLDGKPRLVVWIVLGAFALKTWIAGASSAKR